MRFIKVALVVAVAAALAVAVAAVTGSSDSTAAPAHRHAHQQTGPGQTPAADLRVRLDRLLSEHAALAIEATRRGLRGDSDFKAVAASLDRNSVALANTIGTVYGAQARNQFLNGKFMWRAHIRFFVDYTVGLAKKDRAAQKRAVNNLNGYIGAFSAFLAKATGLPPAAVRASITEHVMQLKGQIDAYSNRQYAKAYRLERAAFAHMFMTGDTLAGAIAKQFPQKFPR